MTKAHLLYLQDKVAYARDQSAYKELYLYFYPTLYKFTFIIVQEELPAEEIVSEVITQVWLMDHKLAYINHLKTYLITAARNRALTYLKKNSLQIPLREEEHGQVAAHTEGPEQKLMTMELSSVIERTVQALPQKCQLVFRLIKEEGLSYKEAGSILQLSQNTLETHMCTALKRLRHALDTYLQKKNS